MELLLPPKRVLPIRTAARSSLAQAKPMPSLPWVTSMASSTRFTSLRAGWGAPAAMSRMPSLGRGARAADRAASTRSRGALPQ